mgnify:CR=1 FL=1
MRLEPELAHRDNGESKYVPIPRHLWERIKRALVVGHAHADEIDLGIIHEVPYRYIDGLRELDKDVAK